MEVPKKVGSKRVQKKTGHRGVKAIKPPIAEINQILIDNFGIITQCADILNIQPKTLHSWINDSPTLQETVKLSRTRMLDVAESQLVKNIKAGKETSLIFMLKCLGKQRGYIQENQVEVNHNVRQIIINVPDEQSKMMLDEIIRTINLENNEQKLLGDE